MMFLQLYDKLYLIQESALFKVQFAKKKQKNIKIDVHMYLVFKFYSYEHFVFNIIMKNQSVKATQNIKGKL